MNRTIHFLMLVLPAVQEALEEAFLDEPAAPPPERTPVAAFDIETWTTGPGNDTVALGTAVHDILEQAFARTAEDLAQDFVTEVWPTVPSPSEDEPVPWLDALDDTADHTALLREFLQPGTPVTDGRDGPKVGKVLATLRLTGPAPGLVELSPGYYVSGGPTIPPDGAVVNYGHNLQDIGIVHNGRVYWADFEDEDVDIDPYRPAEHHVHTAPYADLDLKAVSAAFTQTAPARYGWSS